MVDSLDRLRRLAEDIVVPDTRPEDDLARGRGRRRTRTRVVVGGTVAATAVVGSGLALLSGTTGGGVSGTRDLDPGFAGPGTATASTSPPAPSKPRVVHRHRVAKKDAPGPSGRDVLSDAQAQAYRDALNGCRDVLREDLDPGGTRIQTTRITGLQVSTSVDGVSALGTKLDWNGGGLLQVAVRHTLEGVQFFCDGTCVQRVVPGTSKVLVQTSPGLISVAAFQDDGDIVALTADESFGNDGTSTSALGLTVHQVVQAAADPRLDLTDSLVPGELPMSFFR